MDFRAGDANNGETGFALIIKSSMRQLCSRFIGQVRCDCPAIPVGLSRTSPYAGESAEFSMTVSARFFTGSPQVPVNCVLSV
jgi:hypothetical protein